MHPSPLTYDELWARTLSYASAIKSQDAAAQVLGPVPWGWCAYFYSAADGCRPGADRAAHGGLDILPWYLQQVRSHELATGVRLVDVIDVHYYPQGSNVALSSDESAGTAALRLRSVKSLYDPSYVDESWIGRPVDLIPRPKQWIAAYLPGASSRSPSTTGATNPASCGGTRRTRWSGKRGSKTAQSSETLSNLAVLSASAPYLSSNCFGQADH